MVRLIWKTEKNKKDDTKRLKSRCKVEKAQTGGAAIWEAGVGVEETSAGTSGPK